MTGSIKTCCEEFADYCLGELKRLVDEKLADGSEWPEEIYETAVPPEPTNDDFDWPDIIY
jgi:hypothetical protein